MKEFNSIDITKHSLCISHPQMISRIMKLSVKLPGRKNSNLYTKEQKKIHSRRVQSALSVKEERTWTQLRWLASLMEEGSISRRTVETWKGELCWLG